MRDENSHKSESCVYEAGANESPTFDVFLDAGLDGRGAGAPIRLRVETQLGFTMVKYIRAIEFIDDYRAIGTFEVGTLDSECVQRARIEP